MSKKKKKSNCIARLNVDSPEHFFVLALRAIHKEQGKYDFVHLDKILERMPVSAQHSIRDFENGKLDVLQRTQIIEINMVNDLKFQIHQDHWIPFDQIYKAPG